MDYRIFAVHTWSFFCACIHMGVGHTYGESVQHFWLGKTHRPTLYQYQYQLSHPVNATPDEMSISVCVNWTWTKNNQQMNNAQNLSPILSLWSIFFMIMLYIVCLSMKSISSKNSWKQIVSESHLNCWSINAIISKVLFTQTMAVAL